VSKGTCWECEAEGVHIHNHHVVPRSRGGTKTVPLCEACHAHAHHRDKAMTTSATTSAAMVDMRTRGLYTGGRVRYGFKLGADGSTLEEDATEQRVLGIVRHLRAEGLSLRAVARNLEAAGYYARGGKIWAPNTLSKLEAAP
jgi:hypothetical protein